MGDPAGCTGSGWTRRRGRCPSGPRRAGRRARIAAILLGLIVWAAFPRTPAASAPAKGAGAGAQETRGGANPRLPRGILETEQAAVRWLQARMVPNATVPSPEPGRRRLLLSYEVPPSDPLFPFVAYKSFIYDDALGAVALTMVGEYRQAEYVLSALSRLVREDGSLWFAYNTHNNWPDEGDHEGALIRTGSVAWAGYAFAYYLETRAKEDRGFIGKDPLASGFLEAAKSIARYVLSNQVLDKADRRHGLVTGGRGSYLLAIPAGAAKPEESYEQSPMRWVSTEHNIDSYFFLKALGRLTSDARYTKAAELIGGRLMSLWSEKDVQFHQGILEGGATDVELPLDGATWGALFLLDAGREKLARMCLEAAESRFRSKDGAAAGYRPYASKLVYEDEKVNRYFFPENPGRLWRELDFVWGEGSFGAAAAHARGGNPGEALRALESLLPLSENGGFRYASREVPYQFSDYPSVASTAWFVIAVEMYRGGPKGDLFWGE